MNNDDAMVTLTLTAKDARIMIHTYGWAVSNSEAEGSYGERLWDIYWDMKGQSSRQQDRAKQIDQDPGDFD